ncbi:hypothetical protein Pfo_014610 [Paulownia fortunei]|nr:hypothetical protein Pfo_014610 [Paulownia fortunei]
MYKENIDKRDYCLLDSTATYSILTNKIYFSSPIEIIDGSGNVIIILLIGTTLQIENALLSDRSKRNLLSFKGVRHNGYYLEILIENNKKCICITSYEMKKRTIHEKFEATASGLYCLVNPKIFGLWHDRLDHPQTIMMHRIAEHIIRRSLKNTKMLMSKDYLCESLIFVDQINPTSGPLRYFMVIVGISYRWSHVYLLSTCNIIFALLMSIVQHWELMLSTY